MFGSCLPPVVCRSARVLCMLFVFIIVVCVLFVFVLCLVYPILLVFVDFLIALSVFSNVYFLFTTRLITDYDLLSHF